MVVSRPDPSNVSGAASTELPKLTDTADERPSITEVNGTVARFTMAYSPAAGDRFTFGPPLAQKLPSWIFLGIALTLTAIVLVAYQSSGSSPLYTWVVEGDAQRPLRSLPLSLIVLLSAVATVIRARMRGVIVRAEGVEARDILAMGMPRVRSWGWAQIDRLVVDDESVMLELWNGTYERLPRVQDGRKLADLLSSIAIARGKQVTRLASPAADVPPPRR